eukprot:NODE_3697_length_932_cov_22.332956_g3398_i0.p1 GENE.NODE_3697_length_932_cov_22.332956_g3398_i0~~NODE_3697_length_932_cov_22.332956_g3398_i0.p1  ORF type:complete len:230 (-),score=47.53 NODE_3697_length_932_cov_22.332956_g3398_i0:155-844(-)
MMKIASRTLVEKLRVKVDKSSKLARDDGETVHFLVTQHLQPNYSRRCLGLATLDACSDERSSVVQRYTDHTTGFCSSVNLALAADSSSLEEHGAYVAQLRKAILELPIVDEGVGVFYRGVEMSPEELDAMESQRTFFIPSFTSTTSDREKAYSKNCLIAIKSGQTRLAATITPDLSRFYDSERETLFACYTPFWLERTEKVNGRLVITLNVSDCFEGLRHLAAESSWCT